MSDSGCAEVESTWETTIVEGASGRRSGLLLITAIVLSYAFGVTGRDLWIPDEIRVGEIAREMYSSESYAIPTLAGEPFLEKPPLYHWSVTACYSLWGVSAVSARLPAAIYGLLGLLFFFLLARRLAGSRVAHVATALLSVCYAFITLTHQALVDSPLATFVIATLYAWVAFEQRRSARAAWGWTCLAGIFLALAFYSKGVLGLGLPIAVGGVYALLRRRSDLLLRAIPLSGLTAVACLVPWFGAIFQQGGSEALTLVLWDNTLQRVLPFVGGDYSGGHERPFYYYLLQLPGILLPWTVLLVAAMRGHWKGRRGETLPGRRFAAIWFFVGLGLLSLVGTKRALYLLPLLGGAALYVAVWIEPILSGRVGADRFDRLCWLLTLLVLPGATLGYAGYALATDRSIPMAVLLALLVLGGVALVFQSWKSEERWIRTGVGGWLLALTMWGYAGGVILPADNDQQSGREFCEAVDQKVPAGAALISFLPNEALLAMVPFYTGRQPLPEWDIDAMRKRLQEPGPVWVVTIERLRGGREPYLLEWLKPARPEVVLDGTADGGTYRLLLLRGGEVDASSKSKSPLGREDRVFPDGPLGREITR